MRWGELLGCDAPVWTLTTPPSIRDRASIATPERGRPVWCGSCDVDTRHRERDDGLVYRCPRCHPLAPPPPMTSWTPALSRYTVHKGA